MTSQVLLLLAIALEPAAVNSDPLQFGCTFLEPDSYVRISATPNSPLPKLTPNGLVVVDVFANGPAEASGIKPLDVIRSVAGQPTRTLEDLKAAIGTAELQEPLEVEISPLLKESGPDRLAAVFPRKKSDISKLAMKSIRDDVADHTWIMHSRDSSSDSPSSIRLYFEVVDDMATNLRVKIQYTGDEWVHAHTIRFKCGEERYVFKSDLFKWDHEILSAGMVLEKTDQSAGDIAQAMRNMVGKGDITMRLEGKRVFDRTLSREEVIELSQVLDAYDAGKPWNEPTPIPRIPVKTIKKPPNVPATAAAKPETKDPEKMAQSALDLATTIRRKNKATGDRRLKEILEKWPDTEAASEARKLLGE